MRLLNLLEVLRRLAPEHLAEDWDKVGLQVGDPAWSVRRAMLCIDLTAPVLEEAAREKVKLIVAYHPPIFSPLAALTSLDHKQHLILKAAQSRTAIYSPHTALDAAPGGVNDWLCLAVGDGEVRSIKRSRTGQDRTFKVVTFVPQVACESLRQAMSAAGAGRIGDYEECSFMSNGYGTFRGGPSTHPTIGRRGRRETVSEARIEMICGAPDLALVIASLRAAHPYEEPAFDVYPLVAAPAVSGPGQGRVVTLHRPMAISTLVRHLKKQLGVNHLELAMPAAVRSVRHIGVCAGAGRAMLDEAGSIDLFVTGEMRHHDVLSAVQRGIGVILAGHTQTERPYLPVYRQRILKEAGNSVQWLISASDRPPSRLV